ncbi:MAG: endolytic transglycosylase MltG [Halioglobus sp.]
MIRRILVLFLLATLVVVMLVKEAQHRWLAPLSIAPEGYHLVVEPGQRLRAIVEHMQEQGVVSYPYLLLAYGRWTGLDEKIKRGEYLIPAGTTAGKLLSLLNEGKVIQYQVTFPEGITLSRAIELLAQQPHLQRLLTGTHDERITTLTASYPGPEGLFFPDSYRYDKGASDWQILQRAYQRMQAVLDQEWAGKESSLPYETAYEALIMASIVERETGVPVERQQIAGVFVLRLNKRMRLQTDPSVIYGLGPTFDGNLTRKHLQDESNPYNSYRHKGLPPTAISLPGRASIHAALHPGKGEALYFVAKGDGSHVFSKTLQEHQKAVRSYQLNRSKNYRSSPGKK